MLEFYLNDKPFLLDRTKSVRMTHQNPACNVTEFPGDVTLGIEVPVNDVNNALLGYPGIFENNRKSSSREYPDFEIRYSGVLLMGGTLIITNTSTESYSGWLRSDVGNLGEEHRERKVNESPSFNVAKSFVNKADYNPESDEYGCPRVYNTEFFTDKGEKVTITLSAPNPNYTGEWLSTITLWTSRDNNENIYTAKEVEDLTWAFLNSAGYFVNYKNPDGTIKTPVSVSAGGPESIAKDLKVHAVTPMLFLNYLLRTIFFDAGFYLDKNFLADHPDLKKLILYNNFDITQVQYVKSTTQVIIPGTSHGDVEAYPITYGFDVEDIRRDYEKDFYYKDLVPQVHIKDLLLGIQNYLNVFFFFRPGRKICDIIDRESILTDHAIDLDKWFTGSWNMGDKLDVTLKFTFDHDEKDLMFTEYWQNIDDLRQKEKAPVMDWNELESISSAEMEEIRFIKSQNRYVQWKVWVKTEQDPHTGNDLQKKYIGWNHLTDGFQNGFFNYLKDDIETIPTVFGPISGDTRATVRQKGNMRSEMFSYESFKPRLLFYHDNNEATYKTENISLDWEREGTGLIQSRWLNWARFWCNRQPVECKMHFSLNQLDFMLRNIYKKFRTREGEFIIESMETEFGLDQIGITTIKGYKINYAPIVYKLTDIWKINDPIWIDDTIRDDFDWILLK